VLLGVASRSTTNCCKRIINCSNNMDNDIFSINSLFRFVDDANNINVN
jgi:hypothetical protein